MSVKVDRETGNAGSVLTVAGFDVQVNYCRHICPDSVGCSRSHVHNGASHVHRVRVTIRVRVRFCGH